MAEIPTLEGKLYLADVDDLFSRRIVGFAIGEHADVALARPPSRPPWRSWGGTVAGVILHTDRGSTYTADAFTEACEHRRIRETVGRTDSCLDKAAAESLFSTLAHELLSRITFRTKEEARRRVATWTDHCNHRNRHSVRGNTSPSTPKWLLH